MVYSSSSHDQMALVLWSFIFLRIIKDPKELVFIWAVFINSYGIRKLKFKKKKKIKIFTY